MTDRELLLKEGYRITVEKQRGCHKTVGWFDPEEGHCVPQGWLIKKVRARVKSRKLALKLAMDESNKTTKRK